MKIDKKTLEMLGALPDAKLWAMLRIVSASAGLTLPERMPDAEHMRNLRAALSNVGDEDIRRASELAAIYKGEGK